MIFGEVRAVRIDASRRRRPRRLETSGEASWKRLSARTSLQSQPHLCYYNEAVATIKIKEGATAVLHPNQFQVNEAWIAFQLNDTPVRTEADGDFHVFAIMDAASCYIFGSEFVPVGSADLSQTAARHLLEAGRAHTKNWPKTLYIPTDQPANVLSVEATNLGIAVVRVSQKQLSAFIREAREGFREFRNGKCAK